MQASSEAVTMFQHSLLSPTQHFAPLWDNKSSAPTNSVFTTLLTALLTSNIFLKLFCLSAPSEFSSYQVTKPSPPADGFDKFPTLLILNLAVTVRENVGTKNFVGWQLTRSMLSGSWCYVTEVSLTNNSTSAHTKTIFLCLLWFVLWPLHYSPLNQYWKII